MEFDNKSYERIMDTLHEGLYFVDLERRITFWNKSAERISGFAAEEVVGRSCSDNILAYIDGLGNHLCRGGCPMILTMADGQSREAEVYMHHRDGHRLPVSVMTCPLTDESGVIIGGVEQFAEISSLGANQVRVKELEKMALLDDLTRLANRKFLQKELQNRVEDEKRLTAPFGILFMDVDFFKEFNDTHGHAAGDAILKCVANTLAANMRPFDMYGRWGGEEFIGIIWDCSPEELEAVGGGVRLLVENATIRQNGDELRVTFSLGATMFRDGDTVEGLINRAVTLMHESKRAGGNRLTIW
jgi:diguanylate cyclase (GGDEF)-like protein/PAS domain S-box-containing protein